MVAPDDPASLRGGLPPPRPDGLMPWGAQEIHALKHSHKWQFSPRNESVDGWRSAIYASQFRPSCDRLLLVEDDLTKAGLGFTAKLWTVALLVAMKDNRVLVEVRMVKQGNATRSDHFERPRWCDREPYTLQCLYQSWTHCPLPDPNATVIRPGGRPLRVSRWPHSEPYVRTGLGRIHRQGIFWHGAKSSAAREAGRFLFRPRKWVTDISDCVMHNAGLRPRGYINVHIRHSVEKSKEGQKLGVSLPTLPSYEPISTALAQDVGTRKIFLQTASPEALERYANFSAANNLELSYTSNSRSENDAWGGWKGGLEMEQATVAAVNAHIGSQGAVSVSPELSIWTHLLSWVFGPDGKPMRATSFCCQPGPCHRTSGGSYSLQVVSSPHLLRAGGLSNTRSQCKERPYKL